MIKKLSILTLSGLIVGVVSIYFFSTNKAFSANTFSVCSGGCAFKKINEALKLAKDGDVIELGPGEYNEEIKIDKNIVIKAKDKNDEVLGNIGFGAPYITIPEKTTINITEVRKFSKTEYPKSSKENVGGKVSKKEVETKTVAKTESDSSALSTPLFDVSVQSKIEGKSSREIIVTLVIFVVIIFTILGYLIFGFFVHHYDKKKDEQDII